MWGVDTEVSCNATVRRQFQHKAKVKELKSVPFKSLRCYYNSSHTFITYLLTWKPRDGECTPSQNKPTITYKIKRKSDIVTALPKSPKWAASMWLGCFLRAAVRLLEKESMLAEMALMATWLGPAASSKAWFLVLLWGECTGTGAAIETGIVKAQGSQNLF